MLSNAESPGNAQTPSGQELPVSNALISTAQVAPLPLATDFHAGKVLGLGAPPAPTQEREEAYIPVSLARAQLSKVVADMHEMKAEQVQKLNEILEHYRKLENDTRERHEARVKALKARAEMKLKESREQFVQLEEAGAAREELHNKEKQTLIEEQAKQRLGHLEAHETWRRELENALQTHEDTFAREQQKALEEIAQMSRAAAFTGERDKQQLSHELQMCSEDALGQAMRVETQLRSTRAALETQHQVFLEHEAKLRRHFAANLDVEWFIYTLIDNIVDKTQQVAETKRAETLSRKLHDLEEKAKAAGSREKILERRLEAARERFDFIEAQAVRETVELLVHAVVVTIGKTTATSDAPTQTLDIEEPKVEVKPVESEVPTLLLDKTKYESEVEVSRERNIALIRSKAALHEAKEKLEAVTKAKKAAKTAVKTWLTAFQGQYGREPTIEEKAQVKDKYLAFKDAEKAFSTQKTYVQTLKLQHRELALRIDASSRWSALGSAVVNVLEENESESESYSSVRGAVDTNVTSRPTTASVSTTEIGVETFVSTAEIGVEAFVSTKDSGTDATTDFRDEAVAVLEKEIQELRSQSAVSTPFIPEVTISAETPSNEEEEDRKRKDEEAQERSRQERAELEDEISGLSREIEERRAEKTRLEVEMEQMRLHLELSEARDSGSFPPSEEKVNARIVDEKDEEIEEGEYEEDEDFETVIAESKDDEELDIDEEKEEQEETESQDVKEDAARSLQLVQIITDAVVRGKAQFSRGDKAKCYQTYAKCAEKVITELQALHDKQRRQLVPALKRVLTESARLPPARGPQTLRKQLDIVRENCDEWLNVREEQATARLAERKARKEAAAAKKQQLMEKKQQKQAERKSEEKKAHKKKSSSSQPPPAGGKALEDAKQKLRTLESKAKADRVKISQLEAALAKAETQMTNGGGNSNLGGNSTSDRRVADLEKKHKKTLEENEKSAKKEIAALSQQLQSAQKASQELQEQSLALQKELGVVGGKAKQLGQLEVEMTQLREQAALVTPLNTELREAKSQYLTLETSYKEEQALRKKYYNQIEDMKGKIRVYARCRPMSNSENDRGCTTCVKFMDEFSLEVSGGNRAAKTFAYDQVFSPASTQPQVFEDTKNLLQSAVDGYNVCIFAYGQTGSGKTFTMTGSEKDPGLSPRAIHHLFQLAEEGKANFTVNFQATMLELYNDSLIDLFHLMEGGGAHDIKLEIKKNEKGMVIVQNATLKKCTTPEQTLKFFEAANKKRQVGATKMNAESSRSHSIFSLLVESYNKTTKVTTVGKLSLVDLAGSERAGKTGATADRLKEAQAINKSLSALGDVISALSTNEKFIPYRNNKLTQLMQDSLGGNAKTLMFVNISPADYNQEETSTSLTYASRVKLITNNANKNSESEQVNRLKAIIKQLRAGKTDVDLEGVLD
ncbi:hypothetical protein V7S43_004292 [Phytophthora oleae]|uniref:Kinesin motor domain-containing protein n=1 Tax=Phytophthora oleae TaxID=2107226 RepID=A0ABD3FZB1_9STRA